MLYILPKPKTIQKQRGNNTFTTVVENMPVITAKKPTRMIIEVWLDDDMIFSFPFWFLQAPTAGTNRLRKL